MDDPRWKVNTETGCWLWQRTIDAAGYGRCGRNGVIRAHRKVYEELVGPIPPGLHLDHLCRVRHCVNPAHLEPVGLTENAVRRAPTHNAHKTHCPAGHPYDDANTVQQGRPGYSVRRCRACMREQRHARYLRLGT